MASRGHAGWCDGVSITTAKLVLYRPTGNRRENFTLAHELAHFLVESDDACLSWLADQRDPGRELEHVCDTIASKLLIPQEVIDLVLDGHAPDATILAALRAAQSHRDRCAGR